MSSTIHFPVWQAMKSIWEFCLAICNRGIDGAPCLDISMSSDVVNGTEEAPWMQIARLRSELDGDHMAIFNGRIVIIHWNPLGRFHFPTFRIRIRRIPQALNSRPGLCGNMRRRWQRLEPHCSAAPGELRWKLIRMAPSWQNPKGFPTSQGLIFPLALHSASQVVT